MGKRKGNLEILPDAQVHEVLKRYVAEALAKSTDGLVPHLPLTMSIQGAQIASAQPKHDHRQSFWVLGSRMLWCYRCGALKIKDQKGWVKPTGKNGKNPASTR